MLKLLCKTTLDTYFNIPECTNIASKRNFVFFCCFFNLNLYFCVAQLCYITEMVKRQPLSESKDLECMTDIWSVLTPEEQKYLKANYHIQNFKKNEILHYEGDRPTHMMSLLKGKIKIYKEGVGGRNQIVRILQPMSYFAYRAIFAEGNYNTSASAFEASSVIMIPKDVILKLVHENNDLANFFIRHLAVDLAISDSRQVNLTQKHIRGRLAESLIFMLDNYGLEEDGVTINMYLSREDLANHSNMTTSNAIRTLSMFVTEKVITMDGRRIKIIDEERLRKISRLG
jgi:CRP/FNR family transcriptional regulator, polysaccharide utilization system transcription regulator